MRSPKRKTSKESFPRELLFVNLISVEELAVIFGLAPQTIRNWIALGKNPSCQDWQEMVFSGKERAGVVKPEGGTTMAIIKRKYRTKKQY